MKQITLKGVKENNLKDIDIDIPRGEVTILTGISGSGKSTLAFDTIFAEGQRRYLESPYQIMHDNLLTGLKNQTWNMYQGFPLQFQLIKKLLCVTHGQLLQL